MQQLSADQVKDCAIKWAKKQGYGEPHSSNASEIRFGSKGSIKVDLTEKYAGVAYSFEEDKCLGSVLPRDKREGYRAEFDPGEGCGL